MNQAEKDQIYEQIIRNSEKTIFISKLTIATNVLTILTSLGFSYYLLYPEAASRNIQQINRVVDQSLCQVSQVIDPKSIPVSLRRKLMCQKPRH